MTLIIPVTTFASWWNPFTWKIFQRPIEVKLEEVITPPTIATSTIIENNQSSAFEQLKKKAATAPTISIPTAQPQKTGGLDLSKYGVTPITDVNLKQPTETWEQIEIRDFAYASANGWTSLVSTNSLGEKRYYYFLNSRIIGGVGKWKQAKNEAEMKEMEISTKELTDYFISQERSKAIQTEMNLELYKLKLNNPPIVYPTNNSVHCTSHSYGGTTYTDCR